MRNNKVFVIGIDGGSWNILKPLMDDGTMPNLLKLVKSGVSGVLKSTIPPVTAPAWTSFQTGVNPGKHGIYEFNNYKPGTYETEFINSKSIPLKTIWQIAGEQGKKIIAVNVPVTYPPYKVNGCMVTGMLTPNTKTTFTYPEELSKEILKEVPDYKIMTTQKAYKLKGLKAFVNELIDTERKRTKVMKYLLNKYEWDLGMIHYQSSDVLQHAAYWYLDPNNPYFDHRKYQIVKKFYKALDEFIGEMFSIVPDEVVKILMSDHGFAPVYKTIRLNNFLYNNMYLKTYKQNLKNKLLFNILIYLRRLDRFEFFRFLIAGNKRKLKIIKDINRKFFRDWEHTKAFSVNGWTYGNIYINLKGREGKGIVSEKEYNILCENIIDLLNNLVDLGKGKVVDCVYKGKVIYKGPYSNYAPDLIIKPKEGYEFTAAFSKGEIFKKNKSKVDHTGGHYEDGIFIINGSMIDFGVNANIENNNDSNIVDLYPTILYLLGLKIPTGIDGNVMNFLIKKPYLKENRVKFIDLSHNNKESEGKNYQDEAEIKRRLRDLGYL